VEGSKRKLKAGVWELRGELGVDPITGKRKQFSETFHGPARRPTRDFATSSTSRPRDDPTGSESRSVSCWTRCSFRRGIAIGSRCDRPRANDDQGALRLTSAVLAYRTKGELLKESETP